MNVTPVVSGEGPVGDGRAGDDECNDDDDPSGAEVHRPHPTGWVVPAAAPPASGRPSLKAEPEAIGGAASSADLPDPPQPPHEHRVVLERVRTVDDPVQQLVVARGGETEPLADRSLLRDVQPPRLPLEVQDRARSVIQTALVGIGCASLAHVPRGSHPIPPGSSTARRLPKSVPEARSGESMGRSPT